MTVLAFWTAGQFFIEKAYVLLVFAGIWALMEGVGDIARAFTLRDAASGGVAAVRITRARAGGAASSPRSRARATAAPRLCASSFA